MGSRPMSEDPGQHVQDQQENADDPGPTDWLLLTDTEWAPEFGEDPPSERVLGGWATWADGSWGRFRANPAYEPATPDSPTDPVDAVLRMLVRDGRGADELMSVLEDTALEIALDADGVALVAEAPDGKPSVLVATATLHRDLVQADGWRATDMHEIADALPDSGVDVLLNPNSPASMRLDADVFRRFSADPDPAVQGEIRTVST